MALPKRREFPSDPTALRDIRRFVHEVVTGGPYGAAAADEITLAVSEACENAISESTADRIEVDLSVHGDRIEVEVADMGRREPPDKRSGRPTGHGLPVMRDVMDEVRIDPPTDAHPETTVRMVRIRRTR